MGLPGPIKLLPSGTLTASETPSETVRTRWPIM